MLVYGGWQHADARHCGSGLLRFETMHTGEALRQSHMVTGVDGCVRLSLWCLQVSGQQPPFLGRAAHNHRNDVLLLSGLWTQADLVEAVDTHEGHCASRMGL